MSELQCSSELCAWRNKIDIKTVHAALHKREIEQIVSYKTAFLNLYAYGWLYAEILNHTPVIYTTCTHSNIFFTSFCRRRNKTGKTKPSLPKVRTHLTSPSWLSCVAPPDGVSCPQHLLDVKSLRYLSSVTLHDRITKSLLHLHKKKKPPSISAQFQVSVVVSPCWTKNRIERDNAG